MIKDAQILFVNLTDKSYKAERLPAEIYRKYPGGSSLGMYLMLKHMDPAVDPLSPDNMLIFSVSPLTGIPISGQSRMCVTTKSPLTGTAGDSQVGGFIPAHVKGNGYDAIVFTGKADTPVYVYIDKDNIQIRDAQKMWGKVTGEAEKLIEQDLGESKIESSIIGPAGENQVLYANIMHMRSRANGRNGVGAVMGSKNLKALVVKKQPSSKAEDPVGMKTLTSNVKERMAANEVILDTALNGSAGVVDFHGAEGFLPTNNWESGVLDDYIKTAGTTITKNILKERDTCFGCAIRCKGVVEVPGKADPEYGGPEYETCATFGSYCGNTDLGDICQANQLCNMYGLDTISCGAVIAFAMDCYEKGLLTKEQADGLELKFGRGDVFAPLIRKIAYKEPGIGDLLAQGSARAAALIGNGAEDLVVTCKGQEWPAHMVQMKPNLAINYAVNNFGADHQSSEHDPTLMAADDSNDWQWANMLESFEKSDAYGILDANKSKFALATQKFYSMLDTLCLCQFAWGPSWQLYGPGDLLDFCKYGMGWNTSIAELQEIGERRINMMRMFNVKLGYGRKDDTLPKKAFLRIPSGPNKGVGITKGDFEKALDAYYEFAGWDKETGIPKAETLQRLGLEWLQ
ncbi:aldehyde ferredoxin oxidoreductase family protein [Sinanaerobacter chloroacetimidivorans]|uniref:Aldehyde ferredoxin oxidoreductase family protein n=1 Tax=Sinanaerobacter chloroacetimidivorans TaxID=2818044 RepID=A0A8J7VZA4_9FIRM|nr:aldehyde ferredoxin oxidoreductase family protein [Sinanaerobacter chloroacetimidivorans]MBR0597902.1 aldehyde ferredoxin oxidoreductase family protein [Sinanaerobacter chloroacetimidivorans]